MPTLTPDYHSVVHAVYVTIRQSALLSPLSPPMCQQCRVDAPQRVKRRYRPNLNSRQSASALDSQCCLCCLCWAVHLGKWSVVGVAWAVHPSLRIDPFLQRCCWACPGVGLGVEVSGLLGRASHLQSLLGRRWLVLGCACCHSKTESVCWARVTSQAITMAYSSLGRRAPSRAEPRPIPGGSESQPPSSRLN